MRDSAEREEGAGYNTYNPCYCLLMAARAILKCFGLDSSSAQREDRRNETSYQGDPPSTAEQGMKGNEDGRAKFSDRGITVRRAPPRPPLGTGKPPGNN
ncbi:hypothetical protein AQUCO_01400496v1 [Aquilegia coerulea]|uniref:Uncharacterized protein n=1 Tax=Aquilegia coerulea TaxID=218851 RepID=A0A2G5DWQ4_AQUCA|nr:hypothetical protein AQUCO_01400496v1 [Aquilegia coerulea]